MKRLFIFFFCLHFSGAFLVYFFRQEKTPVLKKPLQITTLKTLPKEKKTFTLKNSPKKLLSSKKVSKKINNDSSKLYAQLQNTLRKSQIEPLEIIHKNELTVPEKLSSLNIDLLQEIQKDEHLDAFLKKMQNQLILPQLGRVKISIEINPSGRVKNLQILSSENEENALYLKNRLPELIFPCFNKKSKTYTFIFKNL